MRKSERKLDLNLISLLGFVGVNDRPDLADWLEARANQTYFDLVHTAT